MCDHTVIVRFGKAIPADIQGRVMLLAEKYLRDNGLPALVEKETQADDSKLRLRMTDDERRSL